MVCAQPLQNLEGNLFLLNAISARWFPTHGPRHILRRLFPGLSRGPRTGPQSRSVGKAHTCRSLWFISVPYLASMSCGHSSLRLPEPRKAGKVTQVCPEMALDIRRVARPSQIPVPLPACVGFSSLYLESISSMSLKPWWHPGRQCVFFQRWHLQVQRAMLAANWWACVAASLI